MKYEMQLEMWKFTCAACKVTGKSYLPLCMCLIHVPVLAASKWEQPKTKTQICLSILHCKWSISVSLACDTTCFTVDEIGRACSTYAGIEKCTQNFLSPNCPCWPTKHPAPQTPSSRVKHPGHEADDSHPSNANIKDKWRQSSIQLYAFMVCTGTLLSFTWGGAITWKTHAQMGY